MKDVTVKYKNKVILNHLDWIMRSGENWAILGPNGAGKSTIVKLITGENLQGYANNIKIFGMQKGSGEVISEIKKYIGIVSSELQIQYRKDMSVFDVIASGFYDSIGLYHYPIKTEVRITKSWIKRLGLKDLVDQNYDQLSYGQKRMVLLVRAMVKSPLLLILDEPCHGLDMNNRQRILDVIERIGESDKTKLIYITHHTEEIPLCINHLLKLENGRIISSGPINLESTTDLYVEEINKEVAETAEKYRAGNIKGYGNVNGLMKKLNK